MKEGKGLSFYEENEKVPQKLARVKPHTRCGNSELRSQGESRARHGNSELRSQMSRAAQKGGAGESICERMQKGEAGEAHRILCAT